VKVLVVPDKFKGTLTAAEAAQAITRGWRKARPADDLQLLPMSDGGDGFGEVMSTLLEAKPQHVSAVDAAHHPCEATWWWQPETKTAIIESAKVIGLAMLPPGKFHPFELDTFGLGAVLQAAREKGAGKFFVGIGGSATNDGGFGLARALGWKFVDKNNHWIERWTDLHRLAVVSPPEARWLVEMIVAVDVQNCLLGPRGATRVYGPQKGIRPEDFDLAERCLAQLAGVMSKQFSQDFAASPGSGAAGGLGFGLLAFLGAKPEAGFDLFARNAGLQRRMNGVDLVVTGEGAIDESTLMGKGVGQIASLCAKEKISCIGLAGSVSAECRENNFFSHLGALVDLTDASQAKAQPALWLERLAEKVATQLAVANR